MDWAAPVAIAWQFGIGLAGVGGREAEGVEGAGAHLRVFAEFAVELLGPVLVGQPDGDQQVTPVACGQVEHLAQAAEIAGCEQHDSRLGALAGEHLAVVSGPAREVGEQPQNAVRGAGLGEVALDSPFQPRLRAGHRSIVREVLAGAVGQAHATVRNLGQMIK